VRKIILASPRFVVLIIAGLTVFFALQLPKTRLDNDLETFIPRDNPAYLAYKEMEGAFGEEMALSVVLRAREGSFFTGPRLRTLTALTEKLEDLLYVDSVTSLTNTDYIQGTVDGFQVVPVLDPDGFGGSPGEIDELKERLLSWNLFERSLYSPDFRAVQVLVILEPGLPEALREVVYRGTLDLVREAAGDGMDYYIAGNPAITVLISSNMRSDLAVLIPLVAVTVLVSLFLAFRRPGGVILPMVTVLTASIWTLGLMALLGISLSMIATVIPVMMIAVGSAYGIHIVNHYYDDTGSREGPLEDRAVAASLERTLAVVGRPVLLAGLTTMAGFGSLAVSRVIPIREFGIFTTFGVASSLLVSLTLIPALIRLQGGRSLSGRGPVRRRKRSPRTPFLYRPYLFLVGKPRRLPLLILAFLLLGGIGASRLVIDNVMVEYFKKGTSIRRADDFLRRNFSGTRSFSVVVTGPHRGSLTDPEALAAMDGLARMLREEVPEVAKVISFSDFIRRMNLVLHQDMDSGEGYDEIPLDPARYGLENREELRNLISQYLLLYSGSMEKWADDSLEPSSARMMVMLASSGGRATPGIVEKIHSYARDRFPRDYRVEAAGFALIERALLELIVESQWWSVALSLLMVFVILWINFRSPLIGLIGLAPLSFSILFNFAVMGYGGIKLDISTAMVASVAIGIGIDYTIHYLSRHALMAEHQQDRDLQVHLTLSSTGKAITFNAASVGAGFAVLLFSQFKPLIFFGLLIVLTMATSSLAAMTLLPAVLKKTGASLKAPTI